jgi:hypothetical protein
VQADSLGTQNGSLARQKNRGRGLQKEERLLGLSVVEFRNVIAAGVAFVNGDNAVLGPWKYSRIVPADANHLSTIGSYGGGHCEEVWGWEGNEVLLRGAFASIVNK